MLENIYNLEREYLFYATVLPGTRSKKARERTAIRKEITQKSDNFPVILRDKREILTQQKQRWRKREQIV